MKHSALETAEGFAKMISDAIDYANLSNKQVAKMLFVNERTVDRWREGISQPDPTTLFKLFRMINVPMIPFLIDNADFNQNDDSKQNVLNFIENYCSASELRDMEFNLTFRHGSSVASQLALISMLNHMKLEYRLLIAKMVLNMWEIASANDGLQYADQALPDVDKVYSAVVKSHIALKEGKDSYTDI